MELINYIQNLGLGTSYAIPETIYIIDKQYSIIIENSGFVYFHDEKASFHKDKYHFIENIPKLKEMYFERIGINLDVMLRKYKIEILKQNIKSKK